jgi:hypothetical protein
MIQKSFVMMKPDAVQRRLMGKILSRFEEKGLQIVAVKLMQIDEDLAKTHYGEHADKPFFGSLIEYITSSPSLAMVIEGEEAITFKRRSPLRILTPFLIFTCNTPFTVETSNKSTKLSEPYIETVVLEPLL